MFKMERFFVKIIVLLTLVKGSHESCANVEPEIDFTKVATMCISSIVSGTRVFIDTHLAKDMSLMSGTVCNCSIKTQLGKVMNITSYFIGDVDSECGSSIIYDSDGLPSRSKTTSCKTEQFAVPSHDMTINFDKDKAPYQSEYCLDIQLKYCSDSEFQCNDGQCIPGYARCDSLPECNDMSDEQNCGVSTSCLEGQVRCDDGTKCIQATQKCDGVVHCPDSSDEPPDCAGLTTDSVVQPTAMTTTPNIIVTCTESLYTPTAATTTTATTQTRVVHNTESTTPKQEETTTHKEDDSTSTVIYIVMAVVVCLILIVIVVVAVVISRKHHRV